MKQWLARASVVLVVVLGGSNQGRAEDAIVTNSGVPGGLVVHLGCADGELTARLRPRPAYVVHGLDTDPLLVAEARERFLAEKCSGPVSAAVFDGEHLPYVDNMVNLLVVSSVFHVSDAEMLRVLAPGGVLLKRADADWSKQVKPVPAELDEWTHYLHGPDNNAVSRDSAVTAPLRHLQWQAGPRYSRHHDTSSSIPAVVTSGGRLFSIVDEGPRASILWDADWQLVARDAFNGVLLWRRKIDQWTDQLWPLKSGPSNTPRRLVARGNAVYATLGLLCPVSKLDAATGKTLRVYAQTEKTEEIILKDGVLYLVINPTIDPRQRGGSWQRGPKLAAAVAESDGAVLWRRELPWIAPVTLTVGDDHVFLCDGPTIRALDRQSGRQVWQSKELPWREKMPTYFAPTLVAADDCLLYAGGENWHEHAGSRGLLTCLDARTGHIKWQQPHPPSGYQSPQDIFVIRGRVWCGSLNSKPGEFDTRYPDVAPSTGEFISYDLDTGEAGRTIPRGADCYWFHHRCHRAKATERFFLTSRTGIEMIDRQSGQWHLHHWVRGACLYGIMPANGLIYAPPHPCACYPEAKLSGFNALAARRTPAPEPTEAERLLKGPAFGSISEEPAEPPSAADWPTFRGDMARSGSVDTVVEAANLEVKWRSRIGTRLSQPVVAGGRVLVAAVDAHTVYALDQASGRVQWKYVAGARIDSPPTFHQGTVIFGSADGWVYCLRASDGELVWRFLAARCDRRLMVREQLESVWPVHGSILIRDGVAYLLSGRSMFLDGGLTLYRLNPATGEVLSKVDGCQGPEHGQGLPRVRACARHAGRLVRHSQQRGRLYLHALTAV